MVADALHAMAVTVLQDLLAPLLPPVPVPPPPAAASPVLTSQVDNCQQIAVVAAGQSFVLKCSCRYVTPQSCNVMLLIIQSSWQLDTTCLATLMSPFHKHQHASLTTSPLTCHAQAPLLPLEGERAAAAGAKAAAPPPVPDAPATSTCILRLELLIDVAKGELRLAPSVSAFSGQLAQLQRGLVALVKGVPRLLLDPHLQVGGGMTMQRLLLTLTQICHASNN